MRTYVRAVDIPVQKATIQPQRFVSYKFKPQNPTERQQLVANGLLEGILEEYEADEDHELDFNGLMAAMPVEVAHVASARWFSTTNWDDAVDRLLERSSQFEMECAFQIEKVIKEKELRHDRNQAATRISVEHGTVSTR